MVGRVGGAKIDYSEEEEARLTAALVKWRASGTKADSTGEFTARRARSRMKHAQARAQARAHQYTT